MPSCSYTGTPGIAFDGFLYFHLLNDVRIGLFDELSEPGERLALANL